MKTFRISLFKTCLSTHLAAQLQLPLLLMLLLLLALALPATAGPGAHGPNGEHLDGPAQAAAVASVPRLEAHTESFELVAELRRGQFTVVVDRYDSNEPVLGAKLDVETGAVKAQATFRPEQGDYVVNDPAFLKAISTPGEHSLVFTLLAGQDNDLLDGTFQMTAGAAKPSNDHGHGHGHGHTLEYALWAAAGLGALGLVGAWVLRRQRPGRTLSRQGAKS